MLLNCSELENCQSPSILDRFRRAQLNTSDVASLLLKKKNIEQQDQCCTCTEGLRSGRLTCGALLLLLLLMLRVLRGVVVVLHGGGQQRFVGAVAPRVGRVHCRHLQVGHHRGSVRRASARTRRTRVGSTVRV